MSLRSLWHHWAFGALFHKNQANQIDVKDAAQKIISIIDQTLTLWSEAEPIFDAIVSDEAETSANEVKAELGQIKTDMESVTLLTDIPEKLDKYRFADDDDRNDFYHSQIALGMTILSDEKITLGEGVLFTLPVISFIKEHK